MSSEDNKKKVSAILVLEVLGRPPEFLTETLNNLIKAVGEEKGTIVKEAKINSPTELKDQKGFYVSFTEIEVEVEEILYLAILMFKYMPAHVEIVSPANINLPISSWNDIFNELVRRLHGYEEIAKMMQTEKVILENQLRTLLEAENKKEEEKDIKAKKTRKKKEEND